MTRRLRHLRRVRALPDCLDETLEADAALPLDVAHHAKVTNLGQSRVRRRSLDEPAELVASQNPILVPVVLIEDVAQASVLTLEHGN